MTLEKAKTIAPRMANSMETQFIIGTPDDCEIITAYGMMGSSVKVLNGKRVLASRSFAGTDYANDQQGIWIDHNGEEKSEG